MMNKVNDINQNADLPDESMKRSVPEILRSISHEFRMAIREEKKRKTSPPKIHEKNIKRLKEE